MVLSLDQWKGKVAVVTGASDGIGANIVQRLIQEGLTVSLKMFSCIQSFFIIQK